MNDPRKGASEDRTPDQETPRLRSSGAPLDPDSIGLGDGGPDGGVLDRFGARSRWVGIALAVATIVSYALTFIPPFNPQDASILLLAATPIVAIGWLLGFWGGTLAAFVVIPLNAFLFSLVTGRTFTQILTAQDDPVPLLILMVLGAVMGGLRDLAEQMRRELVTRLEVEETGRETEERYRFVAESASDGIITLDQERRILFANRAAEKMFGVSGADMVGRPFRVLIPERLREDHDAALRRHLETVVTGSPQVPLQIAGLGASQREITLEISFGEYVENDEHILTGVIRDVTERNQLEQMLKRAKDDAERANRATNEFLSRLSHELRTPLNAILDFAQLLELDQLDAKQTESVDRILKAARHLLTLVDEVLDIGRIEAGRMPLSLEPIHVGSVVREAWELVRPRAERSAITLTDGTLHECDVSVTADPQRLKQIIVNLLSNAVKYNGENGRVTIRCSRGMTGPNRVRFSVTDTGRGLSREAQQRLFQPFERLGAEATGIEGTGIGLAVCRGLVEAMDGAIGVESTPGDGSTFWFELPLARLRGHAQDP